MSSQDFSIAILALVNDPIFCRMRLKYRLVFLTILANICRFERSFRIGSHIVKILPGQFCTSIRNLVALCNRNNHFKEDMVDASMIQRALSLFVKMRIVRHEVIHSRSIITLTYRSSCEKLSYEHFHDTTDTATETVNNTSNGREKENFQRTTDTATDTALAENVHNSKETPKMAVNDDQNQHQTDTEKNSSNGRENEAKLTKNRYLKIVILCKHILPLESCIRNGIGMLRITPLRGRARSAHAEGARKSARVARKRAPTPLLFSPEKRGEEGDSLQGSGEKSDIRKKESPQEYVNNLSLDLLWKVSVDEKIAEGMSSKPGLKQKDIAFWLKKYECKEIAECLLRASKAKVESSYPGYVTKLLKDSVVKKQSNAQSGKVLVMNFVKENRLKHVQMKKDYFVDGVSRDQIPYTLPASTIIEILKRSVSRSKEFDEIEEYISD